MLLDHDRQQRCHRLPLGPRWPIASRMPDAWKRWPTIPARRLDAADAGAALYVAAALQVYFTRVGGGFAGRLPAVAAAARALPLLWLDAGAGRSDRHRAETPGVRYLYCSLCATAWNHVRAVCITCGEARALSLQGIEGDAGVGQGRDLRPCHTYAKMLYQARDTQVDPFADDLATLGLDLLVAEAGWARHAPNPLLLIGSGV